MSDPTQPRYDRIGAGYARTRREDPRLMALIENALGSARTVVNVGAGAGSYEPRGRHVIAIKPSDTMAQRPLEQERYLAEERRGRKVPNKKVSVCSRNKIAAPIQG